MFNVCAKCGEYRPDKTIDPDGPYAMCPACGYRHPFRQMPLLLIGGPSGSGKSAVLQALAGRLTSVVLLDCDILWCAPFNQLETKYRDYFELWLRMAKNIGQSGRPVALFGGGVGVPENIEPCVERRYFSAVHYLALVCQPEVLEARLRARPAWRKSGGDDFIARHLEFNHWLMADGRHVVPPITLADTTSDSISQTAGTVAAWIAEHIASEP